MGKVMAFIMYGGRWEGNPPVFVGAKAMGILIPVDCTYIGLCDIICESLNIDSSMHYVTLKYDAMSPPVPLIKLRNDQDVLIWMELKKDSSKTSYPLFVESQALTEAQPLSLQRPSQEEIGSNNVSKNKIAGKRLEETSNFCENMSSPVLTPRNINSTPSPVEEYFHPVEEECEASIPKPPFFPIPFVEEDQNEHIWEFEVKKNEECSDASYDGLQLRTIYKNKKELKKELSFLAIRKHFQFKVKKSTKKVLVVTCLDDQCKWRVRGIQVRQTELFMITKYVRDHTCSLDIMVGDHRQATSWIIGECIKKRVQTKKGGYKPQDIISDIQLDHGVNISYEKAWRARESVYETLRGSPEANYSVLPSYLYMLEKMNPGSVVDLVTDDRNQFKYLFVALNASIKGWMNCAPVVAIDGTFLMSKYHGTMFVAVCKSGDNHIFPLAVGIGDSENDDSWEWFLNKFKLAYGEREGLVFVSDRHKSIATVLKKVFPNAMHGICMYHLKGNLKASYSKVMVDDLFLLCAKAYRMCQFEHYMHQMAMLDPRIRPYLHKIGYEKWSRAYATGKRYSILTTNIAESMNSATKHGRGLPVAAFVEWFRGMLQSWFCKRLTIGLKMASPLTTWAEDELRKRNKASLYMKVITKFGSSFFNYLNVVLMVYIYFNRLKL